MIKAFETNKNYLMGWIGDSELKTEYTVIKRTEKTVTVKEISNNKVKNCRIKVYDNCEYIKPFGTYSMSPSLYANKLKN